MTYPEIQWVRSALLHLTAVGAVKENATSTGVLVKHDAFFQSPGYKAFDSVEDVLHLWPEVAAYPGRPDVIPS